MLREAIFEKVFELEVVSEASKLSKSDSGANVSFCDTNRDGSSDEQNRLE